MNAVLLEGICAFRSKRVSHARGASAPDNARTARTVARKSLPGMDRRLQGHVDFALDALGRQRKELSDTMVKHQLKLADRQCRIAELSQRVQDIITVLVTAIWGHGKRDEASVASADILCQDLRRKLTGE